MFITSFRGVPGRAGAPACMPCGLWPVRVMTTVEALGRDTMEAKRTVTAEYVRSALGCGERVRRAAHGAPVRRLRVCRADVRRGPSSSDFGTSFLITVRNGDGERWIVSRRRWKGCPRVLSTTFFLRKHLRKKIMNTHSVLH